ncbi:NAC domain-containing protein 83-like isoform X2 [Salvia miltiorrhiza]|uniref:NAC domain-containing protein 83-like isoform X2 n=1 Tax=Salvia miltiorrhiza TaxID=226208 RepID=UPI0025AB65EF|nr:NAC domain-containing protein 83-like isoform X2 [Salvia miltiorrhiza]
MEKVKVVKNGVLRLPPGFRFHPTDEELVVQYLKRKVLSYPVPASIIPEVDVCKSDPWDLPGDSEQERYFFSTKQVKYPNGNRSNRATVSGYWKATGLDKQIVGTRSHQVVGMKKTLVFYRGKPPKGCRTDWIMHEYRLTTKETWVLCRIFFKRRGAPPPPPVFYDFMANSSSASAASGITQISSSEDREEESSSCNSFPSTSTRKQCV